MALRKPLRRQGFSLIEVLVVIAIIIILVALLMGGLYKAQESSNRIACMNNMRQLGAAFQNYHLTNKEFPTEARNNPSFYKSLLFFVEQQTDASDATQVSVYLCPSRRGKDAGAKRDYGYASSGSAGAPSILDSDPDGSSAAPQGATMEMVNASNGSENTAMLTHVWMSPSTYAGGDATDLGWATKNNGRSNNTMTAYDKANGDVSMLGGPHPNTNPTLFVDGHVVSIPYTDTAWVDRWAYMVEDTSFAGGTGRWVRMWNDGNGGGSGNGGNGSGGPVDTNSGNTLGPVNTTTTPGKPISTPTVTQTPGSAPNTSTRTDVNNSPSQQPTNSGDRDQQYQDTVDNEAAKRAGQAAQAARDAETSAQKAAQESTRATQIATTLTGQGDGPGKVVIIVQNAAETARKEAVNAQEAARNGNLSGAQTAAANAKNAETTATNGRKQLEGMVPSTTPVVTTTPVTTSTPTTTTSPTTSTTTTAPTTTTTTTAPTAPTTSTSSGSSGAGSSGSGGGGYYEWVFIPW